MRSTFIDNELFCTDVDRATTFSRASVSGLVMADHPSAAAFSSGETSSPSKLAQLQPQTPQRRRSFGRSKRVMDPNDEKVLARKRAAERDKVKPSVEFRRVGMVQTGISPFQSSFPSFMVCSVIRCVALALVAVRFVG
jgi:hypothetical protein